MYTPLSEQCLRIMTAADGNQIPTLDVVRRLPKIEMSLSELYRTNDKSCKNAHEILRRSVMAKPKGFIGFEHQLPDVITGQNQDWHLWRVDFYVGRLKLYYVEAAICGSDSPLTGGSALDSIGHFRSCAYAYLVSPAAIGLEFEICGPDQPSWRIRYEMSCSSPTGSHSVRLIETFDGAPAGDFSYSVPALEPFRPVAIYRP